ncbi:cupin domain-containing protein [Nonomuraea sp. NPDC050383]|uniref:cupin domain-containing protein n=1 Tax=Nonomuraea sp. NPDC050383 TaxID=3364362 RepID=UPI0037A03E85
MRPCLSGPRGGGRPRRCGCRGRPGPGGAGASRGCREWFTVLSGTARLHLGERVILVSAGDAAEFSTMVPHAIGAHDGPVEILTIFDHDGQRAHLHGS